MSKVKLGDVMTPHRGYDLPNAQRIDGDVPIIGSSGVSGSHNVARLHDKNVITGRYGTIGKVFYHDGPCWPLNTTLYVEDFHDNNARYVAYLLEAILASPVINGGDKSTVPGIDRNALHAMEIPYIENHDEQGLIANVLSSIDDKIALNKKIMTELEKTSRLIYDYWFTQFDFPDENGKPYRSSGGKMVYNETLKREIPEGWEAVSVNELVRIEKGISYKANDLKGEGVPMINLASFNTDGTYKVEGLKSYSGALDSRKMVSSLDLVMCITQQTAIDLSGKTNVIGKTFFVPDIFSKTTVISTDVCKLMVRNDAYAYVLNGLFKRSDIHKYIVGFANGTKIKHLDTASAFNLRVAVPPNGSDVLRIYSVKVRLFEKEKNNLLRENLRLEALRDWLLPMLMNGQVHVG